MLTDKKFTGEKDIPEPFKLTRPRDYIRFLFGPGMPALSLHFGNR